MEEKFWFLIKEFYSYISENLPRNDVNDNFLGDWRIVKQKLNDGDLQVVIYRKNTEINFMYSEISSNKIEVLMRIDKNNEKQLVDSLVSYFGIVLRKNRLIQTFNFKTVDEFSKYIYQYLLKD